MDELFGTYECNGQEQGSSPFDNHNSTTNTTTTTSSTASHSGGRMMGDGVSSSHSARYNPAPTPTVTPTANNGSTGDPSLHLESSNHHYQHQHPQQHQHHHQHYNSCSNIPTTSSNMFDLLELQQSFTDIQVTSEHHYGSPSSIHPSYSSQSHHHQQQHVTHNNNNNNNNNSVIHNPFDLHNASFNNDTVPTTMTTTPTRSSSVVVQSPISPLSSSNAWENHHHHHPPDAKAPTTIHNNTDAAFDPFDGDAESWAASTADWNENPTPMSLHDDTTFPAYYDVNQSPLPPTQQKENGKDNFINDDDDDDEGWKEGDFANDNDSDESFVDNNNSSRRSCHSSTNKRQPVITTPTNNNYIEKPGQQGPVVIQPVHSATSMPTTNNNQRLITVQVEKSSLQTTTSGVVVIEQSHPGGEFVVANIVPGSLLDSQTTPALIRSGMKLVSINGIYIGNIVGLSPSQVEAMIQNVKGSLVLELLETQQQHQQQPNDTQTKSRTPQTEKLALQQQQQQQSTTSSSHHVSSTAPPAAASPATTPTQPVAHQAKASVTPPIPKNASTHRPSPVGPPSTASNHGSPSSSGQPTTTSAMTTKAAGTPSSTTTLYDSRTFPPYDSNSQRILLQYDPQDKKGNHAGTLKHSANNLEGLQNSLSRFVKDTTTPARAWTAIGVTLNGYPLNVTQVQWIAAQPMAFKPRDNTHYWYDAKSGFCGKIGGDWKYLLEPNLVAIKGSLHPRSSCGNSKITINGRELTTTEVQRFGHAMILLQEGCRYSVDAMGDIRLLSSNNPQPVANWRTVAQRIKTFNQVGNSDGNGGGGGGNADGFSSKEDADARVCAFAAGATWV